MVPHPIPYQGSKRRLAKAILSHIPSCEYNRLFEPFAGSAAITLAAASTNTFQRYVLGDMLQPLISLWDRIAQDPKAIADGYEALWNRERQNPIAEFYLIRSEFNVDQDAAKLLYLLARCVKNAVRFNPDGNFNQSPDKRRKGTKPETMRSELYSAHALLKGRCQTVATDFMELFEQAGEGDFFYLDPPYQGTSAGRDQRYVSGVSRERIIQGLELLNRKQIPFILSYDGSCGDTVYGEPLPDHLAQRVLLDVGRSSQATLNGRQHVTIESLYISANLQTEYHGATVTLASFDQQAELFANA